MFIHERKDWPRFHWNRARLAQPLAAVRHQQGRLIGHMEALGFNLRQEAVLQTLTEDVLKSSEIEGEKLDAGQVRSSIARRLGMDIGALKPADRNVEGVVEMMLDATRHYDKPLTDVRLFAWHASLFPTGSDIHAKPPGDRGPDLSGVEFLALYFTALEDIFCERLKDRLLAEVKSESFHVADQPSLLVSDRSERLGVSRSRFQ